MSLDTLSPGAKQWFAMRDLKRRNAKLPAYRMLGGLGIECFTPLVRLPGPGGLAPREAPLIPDLLFVRESRALLDPVVSSTPTLQYRYLRGSWRTPLVVRDADMERFIRAASSSPSPRYYLPGEVTAGMLGRRVRVVGGPLDGCTGTLLSVRGSRRRRLLVSIPSFLSVAVEVRPEYVQLLEGPRGTATETTPHRNE